MVLVAYLAFFMLLVIPAYFLAKGLREKGGPNPSEDPEDEAARTARRQARVTVTAIIGAAAFGSASYQVILGRGLEQTAALFIGIPSILAIVVVYAVSPRSATGVACKAVTIGLLVSLLFLGEGMLCIVMSAPLFYAVAIVIAEVVELIRRRRRFSHLALSSVALLAFVPMSIEGVTDSTSLNRDEWVTVTRVVNASAQEVEAALFEAPRFERTLPRFLRIGFPRPTTTRIEGEDEAMRWLVRFRGGEMRIDGMEPRAGDLVLQLEQQQHGRLAWRALNDDSHMTHFLNWRESIVQWTPIDDQSTSVTWTLRYRRGLDPAWYFGPWERYATSLAAGYLIDSVATP
jgi:hypothetical protein